MVLPKFAVIGQGFKDIFKTIVKVVIFNLQNLSSFGQDQKQCERVPDACLHQSRVGSKAGSILDNLYRLSFNAITLGLTGANLEVKEKCAANTIEIQHLLFFQHCAGLSLTTSSEHSPSRGTAS